MSYVEQVAQLRELEAAHGRLEAELSLTVTIGGRTAATACVAIAPASGTPTDPTAVRSASLQPEVFQRGGRLLQGFTT